MRKFLPLSLSILLLLFQFAGIAFAAKAAAAEIPVVIDGGGTAYMIPENNSPLPVESAVKVNNGRTGRFHIDFTESGEYYYTIKAEFSENGQTQAANEVFALTVNVFEKKDGTLYTVSVIKNNRTSKKESQVRFQKPPEITTQPKTPKTPKTPRRPGTPRTGDESNLLHYVLISEAASVGLFLLALLYTMNTNKLIREGETAY